MEKKVTKESLLGFIQSSLMKPVASIDSNTKAFSDTKSACILAGIGTFVMMFLNLFTTMITSIFVRSCDFWTGTCKTKIVFSELKSLDYLSLIFKNFLMFALVLFGIALVYFVGSLIIKKALKYSKALAIVVVSIIPYILISMLVAPILGIVYGQLQVFANILGLVYSLLILFMAIKNELKITDIDKAILYNAIVVTVSYIIVYYVFTQNILG